MPTTRKSRRSRRSRSRSRSRSRDGSGIRVHRRPQKGTKQKNTGLSLDDLKRRTIAELQIIARSRGIPFGGMTKGQLIEKIIAYR